MERLLLPFSKFIKIQFCSSVSVSHFFILLCLGLVAGVLSNHSKSNVYTNSREREINKVLKMNLDQHYITTYFNLYQ